MAESLNLNKAVAQIGQGCYKYPSVEVRTSRRQSRSVQLACDRTLKFHYNVHSRIVD